MQRTIVDRGLLEWEAYASTARHGGLQGRSRIVFHCLTDPAQRARFVERAGDRAGAEQVLLAAQPHELVSMLEEAELLD
jgi:hypothetical protein